MRLQTRVFWSAAILMCLLSFAVVSSVLARVATAMVQPQGLSMALDVPEKLAEAHVQTMAANATHVFWTVAVTGEFCPAGGEPAIRRVPLAGGTVETLYHSCTFNPYQLAADATHVYFADWSDNKIKRIPVSGGSPSVVASGSSLILYLSLIHI